MDKTILFGLTGSGRAYQIIKNLSHRHNLIICPTNSEVDTLCEDLSALGFDDYSKFRNWDILPLEPLDSSSDIISERIYSIANINESRIIVASAQSIVQKILPPEFFESLSFSLKVGDEIDKNILLKNLVHAGYIQTDLVESFGHFSFRGKTIDIFPAGSDNPIRVELEEDRITEIRPYNANTQRSTQKINTIRILPSVERINPYSKFYLESGLDFKKRIVDYINNQKLPLKHFEKLNKIWELDLNFPGLIWLNYILYPSKSIFDYLDPSTNLILFDEHQISNKLEILYNELENRLESESLIPEVSDVYISLEEYSKNIEQYQSSYLSGIGIKAPNQRLVQVKQISNAELITALQSQTEKNSFTKIINVLKAWIKEDYKIAIFINSQSRTERFIDNINKYDLTIKQITEPFLTWCNTPSSNSLSIFTGSISKGAKIVDDKIILVAEDEIFSNKTHKKQSKVSNLHKLLNKISQLHANDYIVHQDYGIGIYLGLKNLDIEGIKSDFLELQYQDSKLYLPLQNIRRIEKYNASEGNSPSLDKLSSNRWRLTKEKVKASVMSIAGDLIKLYASRSVQKGWRYDPAGALDEIFAEDFAYDETVDQIKAIEDVLADMAEDKPMDRLICGDVGFGKTEVAMRAAYKAIQHGKQVAILVPTTILVDQHETSFKSRFSSYPFEIAGLSRFNTAKKNTEILNRLANGEIDIVIGTHRLLSRHVSFKDLGLLIIDEEHRFGVKQKERLKAFKKDIDILTMTATPIPRTLHMSLSNIRDISVIATPPAKRQTVKTYLANTTNQIIRDAILRELQRNGQVFILHNRVESIPNYTAEIQELVPEARIAFAHGQMSETELENIMHKFIKYEFDVLVSTAIIESGIDVPNANTIIIDRADRLGLAQLYQLRGRVGRSSKQAYCYLLIPNINKITSTAEQRLEVLQNLDELGQGFSLALQDLEIRGAGNLLGREQSGNVSALGYELYSKILKEAILNLQGSELGIEEMVDPEVKIPVNAFIPEAYIPDISQRLILYQRLSGLKSIPDKEDIRFEIEDRFGSIPVEMEELIDLSLLRGLLKEFGAEKLEAKSENLIISFNQRAKLDVSKLLDLSKSGNIVVRPNNNIIIKNSACKNLTITDIYDCVATIKDIIHLR